ncbi:MAG: hypothetical protein J4F29_23055 [Candidatus Latescibacteria bacterium]|nr:hypothetical protein [Candidatus Latescibacterota bacterium]
MSGANLQSLQALIEFRDALPTLCETAINEVQEMVESARRAVQDAEDTLSDCQADLWDAEDAQQNREESGYDDYSDVEYAQTAVAQAEDHLSQVQAAFMSLQSTASAQSSRLTGHFANAQSVLDQRIQAAKHYIALSAPNAVSLSVNNGPARGWGSTVTTATTRSDHIAASTPAFESGRKARLEGKDRNSNPYRQQGRDRVAEVWDQGWVEGASVDDSNAVVSPLRDTVPAALPALPNGLQWVEIDKISWDGVDGIPDNLAFRKVSKENMREMLETFENQLLPVLSENKDVSADELVMIDKQNACAEGSSNSLRLSHDSMIGSSNTSDVIVLHSKPLSPGQNAEHPAASTPAFESGRKARVEGKDRNSNPYRQLGREGAANIWDQGWEWQLSEKQLAFTSGRHRTLVARELGWKFIPARVLGDGQDDK